MKNHEIKKKYELLFGRHCNNYIFNNNMIEKNIILHIKNFIRK